MTSVRNATSRLVTALGATFLLLVLSFAAGIARPAFAATPIAVGGTAIVTNTDGDPIRVREGAGYDFTPVTVVWEGDRLPVLDGPRTDTQGNRWWKVQAKDGVGWAVYLYLDGAAPPKATPGQVARVANTDGDPLRVRSAPHTEGSVIARLSPGATVTLRSGPVTDKEGITWYEVSAEGVSGWAMTRYLELVASDRVAAPTPAPASNRNAASSESREATEAQPTATRTRAPQPTPTAVPTAAPTAASTRGQYRQWMEEAKAMYPYRDTLDKMWSVMMCESGGNPNASGGGGAWLGLFQYAPSTWRGSWNPYRDASIWDARSQIFATAKAWSNGKQSWWTCYYR